MVVRLTSKRPAAAMSPPRARPPKNGSLTPVSTITSAAACPAERVAAAARAMNSLRMSRLFNFCGDVIPPPPQAGAGEAEAQDHERPRRGLRDGGLAVDAEGDDAEVAD